MVPAMLDAAWRDSESSEKAREVSILLGPIWGNLKGICKTLCYSATHKDIW